MSVRHPTHGERTRSKANGNRLSMVRRELKSEDVSGIPFREGAHRLDSIAGSTVDDRRVCITLTLPLQAVLRHRDGRAVARFLGERLRNCK